MMSKSELHESNLKIDYRVYQELQERHLSGDYDPYKVRKGTRTAIKQAIHKAA